MLPRSTLLALTSSDATADTLADGDVVGVRHDLRCRRCGYGVSVARRRRPRCPMCGKHAWEAAGAATRRSAAI
jgi:rubrerythrin